MNMANFELFKKEWITAHEVSAGNKTPSDLAINKSFEILKHYSMAHIIRAIEVHCGRDKFAPTPADIENIFKERGIFTDLSDVKCPSADEIVALAKLADTPLGVLARIAIGTHDLRNGDSYYLRQRALEVSLKFDSYLKKCLTQDYSSHELETMKKYGVNSKAALAHGLPRPNSKLLDSNESKGRLINAEQ